MKNLTNLENFTNMYMMLTPFQQFGILNMIGAQVLNERGEVKEDCVLILEDAFCGISEKSQGIILDLLKEATSDEPDSDKSKRKENKKRKRK